MFVGVVAIAGFMPSFTAAQSVWDGTSGVNESWGRAENWEGNVVPTFGAGADIEFRGEAAGFLNSYLAASRTIGTLTFNQNSTDDFYIRLREGLNTGGARNLTFDNGSDDAVIHVLSGSAGLFRLGVSAGEGGVILNSDLVINQQSTTAAMQIGGTISGDSSLIKNGVGDFLLNVNNTFSGGLLINQGTVRGNHNDAFGTGTITVNDGTITAGLNTTTRTWGNDILVNGALAVGDTESNAHMVMNGDISGSGSITKAGSARLRLMGDNSFSGGLILDAGRLEVGSATALGTGTFTINGGELTHAGSDHVSISTDNSIVINGDFTYTGVSADNLNLGAGDVTLGTAAGTSRTITTEGQLASLFRFGGTISDGDTANKLLKAGTGATLALDGQNTFTGGFELQAGRVWATEQHSLGVGDVSVFDGATLDLRHANALHNEANLILGESVTLLLTFAGSQELGGLSLDGGLTWLDEGTYDASALGALNAQSDYSGTGAFYVIPEPGTLFLVMAGLALVGYRRRHACS